jgi:hypothetical protein
MPAGSFKWPVAENVTINGRPQAGGVEYPDITRVTAASDLTNLRFFSGRQVGQQ